MMGKKMLRMSAQNSNTLLLYPKRTTATLLNAENINFY